jgi:hypothetical protein
MLLDLLAEWQACGVSENHIDPNKAKGIRANIFNIAIYYIDNFINNSWRKELLKHLKLRIVYSK